MGFTHDHSGNFPHSFEACPDCTRKGVYHMRPEVLGHGESIPDRWRCKYCKHEFPLPPREWEKALAAHRRYDHFHDAPERSELSDEDRRALTWISYVLRRGIEQLETVDDA